MSPAAHGTVGFRASPRLYRGKVLLLALAIVVVSLAEALQTEAREEAAAPAGAEGIERIVLDRAEGIERIVLDRAGAVVAPDAGVPAAPDAGPPAAPEVVFGGAAGPFAEPLPVSCAACGCNAHSLPLAPRAS
ncbi:MAG TPA: hypothetical protein VKZ58_00470 [Longimicrobiales bacterium]|nr:hypothetical protein [Longimicrobiales bacterium]